MHGRLAGVARAPCTAALHGACLGFVGDEREFERESGVCERHRLGGEREI